MTSAFLFPFAWPTHEKEIYKSLQSQIPTSSFTPGRGSAGR